MVAMPIKVLMNRLMLNNDVIEEIQKGHAIHGLGLESVSSWRAARLVSAVASRSQITVFNWFQIFVEWRGELVMRRIRGLVHHVVSMVRLVITMPVIVPDMSATVVYNSRGVMSACTIDHSDMVGTYWEAGMDAPTITPTKVADNVGYSFQGFVRRTTLFLSSRGQCTGTSR